MDEHNPNDIQQEISKLRKTIPRLHWGRLRFMGSLRNLLVSFSLGLVIALPDLIGTDLRTYIKNPQLMLPLVIFFIGIGIAFLLYEFFCPAIIKKFESLADFYEHQINIKKVQMETYPQDPFEANMLHVAKHYINDLGKFSLVRWSILVLYVIGLGSWIILLVRLYSSL